MGVAEGDGKSIDDILASIMEGKTDQPEIFETLKSVATSKDTAKQVVVEPPRRPPPAPPPKLPEEGQFLCPVCDTVVDAEDTVCPGCGAEFSEGESTEYECPVCKAAVPADATKCPSCGVRFAGEGAPEEPPAAPGGRADAPARQAPAPPAAATPSPGGSEVTLPSARSSKAQVASRVAVLRYTARSSRTELPQGDIKLMARELPKLVNDVKPLLISAKRIGLDIEPGKRLINDAVQAGKRRDIEKAVKLIADARRSLDAAFVDFLGARLEALAGEVEKAGGQVPAAVGARIESAMSRLESREYDAAWDDLQAGTDAFRTQAKEFSQTRSILDSDARLLGEVRSMGMDVRDVERLAQQSMSALDRRDLTGAVKLAKQSHDRLVKDVPGFVEGQMKQARDLLLDLKVRGLDLSRPVGYLKEASAHAKGQEWDQALEFLKEFHKEVGKVGKA